jgi:hypothetical protein
MTLVQQTNSEMTTAIQNAATKDLIEEQNKMMNDHVRSQLDDKQLALIGNCTKLWDKQDILKNVFNNLGFKDIVGLPVVQGKRNKIKYEPWYAIKSVADPLGRRVAHLKEQLLKGFEFLTINELEVKIQRPQIGLTEKLALIVPGHLNDNNKNIRLFVNHKAIMTLIRDIAHKAKPVLVKTKDVRPWAKELMTSLDNLDDTISGLIDDLNEVVAEYHQKIRKGELPTVEERKLVDTICDTLTGTKVTTIEENIKEQEVMSKEWLLGKIPQCFIHFFDGVDDVTDISAVYVANLRKYGYDKIVMIPYYDEMDDEWIYKPMFAMTALASFIGHKDPEHITRYTLKDHIVKTGNELNDEIKGWLKQPPPMIFHEGLTEGIFRQTKYISFTSAKYLIATDMKKVQFKDQATKLNRVCDDILELMPRLFKRMNRIVAEYRHKDQQRELLDFRKQNDVIKAERESIKSERLALAMRFHDVILDREETIYIVSSDDKMKIGHYKVGKSTLELLKSRLSTLQTGTPELRVIYQFKCRNAKALEAVIHNTLEGYGIRLTKEWFLIKVLDKLVEFIQMVVDDEEKWLNSTQDFPAITRQAICGYELPDVVIEAPQQLVIEENKEAICKRVTEQVIRALMDGVTPIKPKQITKKAIQEVIDNAKEKINVSKLISIEITLNDQVYLIESEIPDGKKQKRIYIKIKQ